MWNIKVLLFISLWAYLEAKAIQNNVGQDFVLTYLESDHKVDSVGMTVIAVKTTEIIILTDDDEAYKFELEAGASKTLTLSRNRRQSGATISSNVVQVSATEDIIVYGMNCVLSPSDGFLALPTTSLGKEYVIASFKPTSASQFSITAVEDNTLINISLVQSPDKNSQRYQQIQLNRLQTYHFKDEHTDLTGSIVNSDKPVAVISGNKCARLTLNQEHCNFIVEQLLPVKAWGNHFINVPVPGEEHSQENIFRLISAFDGTNANITIADTTKKVTINRGHYHELHVPSDADFHITTSKPCSVMLYIKGIPGKNGFSRPVLMSVIPTEQFSSGQLSSTIGVFDKSVTNYMALITTNNATSLKMDMLPLSKGLKWSKINNRYYSTLFKIPQGAHLLHQTLPTEKLTTYIFGIGQGTSVAYPAATNVMAVSRNCVPTVTHAAGNDIDDDCDGIIDEELQNNIDDDGDGLIDEDLYATSPDLQLDSTLHLQSCDIHSTTKDTYDSKTFNYSINSKCVLYGSSAFSLKKVDSNKLTSRCGNSLMREWILTDACGMTVRKSQQVQVLLPISNKITLPQNFIAKCSSDVSPTVTGKPSVNTSVSCKDVKIPDPSINYIDRVERSSCDEVIYRKWNINYEMFCGENISHTQEIHLVGYRAPILPQIRDLNVSKNAIGVFWSVKPDETNCVTELLCQYKPADSDEAKSRQVDKSVNPIYLTKLLPNTTYIISMYTITKCGRSHTPVEEVITTLVDGEKYTTVTTPYTESSTASDPATTPATTMTSTDKKPGELTGKTTVPNPTSKSTTVDPTSKSAAVNPTSKSTTADPASKSTTADPTSKSTAVDPTSKSTTADPASKSTTVDPTSKSTAPNYTAKSTTYPTANPQINGPVSTGVITVIALVVAISLVTVGGVAYRYYKRGHQSVNVASKKSVPPSQPSSKVPVDIVYAPEVKKGAVPKGTSI
ncbi:IgGFc-binding protein [Trichoplax sp. H2]|nr:IgGFc-binding protein [Trichoplax sp. H2]|eukprot:RDD46707.1 IgGFc-binding protein [Trichoplax sp. H2]